MICLRVLGGPKRVFGRRLVDLRVGHSECWLVLLVVVVMKRRTFCEGELNSRKGVFVGESGGMRV